MKTYEVVYFPMTADIITVGHIKCLQWLKMHCQTLIVGLLNDDALKGYKTCVVPFDERKAILEEMYSVSEVMEQDSLNPEDNIKLCGANAMASGDGFEPEEIKAAKMLKIDLLSIKLEGETKKKYSSTEIKQRIIDNAKGNSRIK